MVHFTRISYDEFVADISTLATTISADDWTPDFLVGIGRGGLVPCAYLSHATGLPMLSIDDSAKVYGFGEQLLAELGLKSSEGVRMLVVDDINDSGRTICRLRDTLEATGGAIDNIRFAVLLDNSRSMTRVDYRARTIDRENGDGWFIFPWETMGPDERHRSDAVEHWRRAD